MAHKKINYAKILENLANIRNAMEFDCMRSGGKVKFNASDLRDLYELESIWNKKLDVERKVAAAKKKENN